MPLDTSGMAGRPRDAAACNVSDITAVFSLRAGADNFVSKLSYIQEVMPILEGLREEQS